MSATGSILTHRYIILKVIVMAICSQMRPLWKLFVCSDASGTVRSSAS